MRTPPTFGGVNRFPRSEGRWPWAVLIVCLLCSPARADFDWGGAISQALSDLAHATIPDAIAPLVTIAENADELALDGLTIALAQRRKELYLDGALNPSAQVDEKINAIEQMISKTRELKDKLNPPHKEQGWDPFYGKMLAGGAVNLPVSSGQSTTASLSLDLSATDPDLRPASYMVLPSPAGRQVQAVEPTAASIAISLHHEGVSGEYRVGVTSFSYTLPSFSLGGVSTGANQLTLTTLPGAPTGKLTMVSGTGGVFAVRFAAVMTNDLYGPGGAIGSPIPVFVQAHGFIDVATGIATVGAEDPLLLPGLPGVAQHAPMFAAPTMASYNAATSKISFKDMFSDVRLGIDTGNDPTVEFIRFSDDTYGTRWNSSDSVIGGSVHIAPLEIAINGEQEVTFNDSTLTIANSEGTLFLAELTNIRYVPATGQFVADVTPQALPEGHPESAWVTEWAAAAGTLLQLLSPQTAGELYLDSAHFTVDGQSAMPDFVNGGVPEPGGASALTAMSVGLLLRRRRGMAGR